MSILNCSTRLTIVNCTGLTASFSCTPQTGHMRLQPLQDAHVHGTIGTSAETFSDWVKEWLHLVSYGPTYDKLEWSVPPENQETVRFQVDHPLTIQMTWSDPSVSWANQVPGEWTIDISKAVDVTMFVRSDIGEYTKRVQYNAPATVSSVKLKPRLEIACDDEIPFTITQVPVADMFWRHGINLHAIVSPQNE